MTFGIGVQKYENYILLSCILIAVLIIASKIKIQMYISKFFNFRKELKKVRKVKMEKITDYSNHTFLGLKGRRKVYTNDEGKNYLVCGTTGSGKTVVLSNYIRTAIEKNYALLIVDGKGDTGKNSILDIVQKINTEYNQKKTIYTIDLNEPEFSDKYNPFKNANATMVKDMLINMTEWSEEHYKLNTERYLQKLLSMMIKANYELCFEKILKGIPKDNFIKLSQYLMKKELISKDEHIVNVEIAEKCSKISEDATARFSLIYESDLGQIFTNDGIDIYEAIEEKAIILFILNPLTYPETSSMIGKLALIDSKKAVGKLFTENDQARKFFIFDEVNVYASPTLLDLINKSRSANITNFLSMQSLSDLDSSVDENFREQVIENCNNYILLRQNSSQNAENWGKIFGTRNTLDVTYQLQQKALNTAETGFGSARRVREFNYHPDDIKTLKTGEGIFLSKDNNTHTKLKINKAF
jgi:type IV secretory pathway TraG/TraD family ATPase VirD4